MPAYDERPTPEAVLKRTRDRIATVRSALVVLRQAGTRDANERARQAAKNLEMLVDRKELRQVSEITAHAAELDAKLAELKSDCERFILQATFEPDRRIRLVRAIAAFVGSPVASGTFLRGGQVASPSRANEG